MEKYFERLVLEVLLAKPDGVTKVRLAKILYLLHKNLVQKDQSTPMDLKFIRMPLGPVPVYFKDLQHLRNILVHQEPTGLSYNKQIFKINKNIEYAYSKYYQLVLDFTQKLDQLQTSQLVEYTHHEPSWLNHKNGEEYFIEKADLERALPTPGKKVLNKEEDEQLLQAYLVDGMLNEIVEDSTSLEYPDL